MTDTLTTAVRAACDAVIPSEIECPWPDCSCLCDEKDGSAILAHLLTTARAEATEAEKERIAAAIEAQSRNDGSEWDAACLACHAAIRAPATQDKEKP